MPALADYDIVAIKISGARTLSREPFSYKDIRNPIFRIFDAVGSTCYSSAGLSPRFKLEIPPHSLPAFSVVRQLCCGR